MLLHPESFDLEPRAADVLARLGDDPRFKPELPSAQVELLTTPVQSLEELAAQLAAGRRDLAAAAEGIGVLAGSSTHPFAAAEGELNPADAYRLTREEYGPVARRQLVFGVHVHVRVGGAERSLAVYNALRSYLGEIAALAANAPFHAGRDTGFASIRPKISELLPRGIPPAFASLEEFADSLAWAARAGVAPQPRMWWWELRMHPVHGTMKRASPSAGDRGRDGCDRHSSAGWFSTFSRATTPASAADPPHLADRREPLVGRSPRARRLDGRSRHRRAPADPRAALGADRPHRDARDKAARP